jgi:hypothetical protein
MVWVIAGRDGQELREAVEDVRTLDPLLACVVITGEPTFEMASWCLRMGVTDVIAWPCHKRELVGRLACAGERTSRDRARAHSRHRSAKTIKTLTKRLREAAVHPESQDLPTPTPTQNSDEAVARIKLATELETLLRQELEVEPLLRTSLEFVIRKLGAMNAAIFLPAGTGDFTLGAFVNYDAPRESAQTMLEDLCHALVPAYEDIAGQHVIAKGDEHAALRGIPTRFVGDATLCVQSLHYEGECIAILATFRDHRQAWDEPMLRSLRIVGDLFGQQLARAANTSQRHHTKDQWDQDADGEDHRGMAA